MCRTRRHSSKIPIENLRHQDGWTVIHVAGTAQERGFTHGFLLHQDIADIMDKFPFIVKEELNISYAKYIKTCHRVITPIIKKQYREFYQELVAICEGAQQANVHISIDVLVAWNALMSMYEYLHNSPAKRTQSSRCSAFIATGKATHDGRVVMGHTTHTGLVSGFFFRIVMYVSPDQGVPFCMQTAAGCIASGTDWFLTQSGIIGCETTIGDINYRPDFTKGNAPYFCRIRQAMQYGKSLDDYATIMTKHNAGDYACSWLFGDVNTQEIMLCELGCNVVNVQRTFQGIYYGMNSAMSPELRNQETDDQEMFDPHTSSGGRNMRMQELLYKKYYGKLNMKHAQDILSDHYNVVTQKKKPGATTICVHTYDDASDYAENYPHGCVDGKVVDATTAKKMTFWGRFGPCCGRGFDAPAFLEHHPRYKKWHHALESYPIRPWSKMSCE